MKVKYFQKWTDAAYVNVGEPIFEPKDLKPKIFENKNKYWFKPWYWSNLVLGMGDEILKSRILAGVSADPGPMLGFWNWIKKNWKWKKYIILEPSGDPETKFRMGFYSKKFEICKISSATRKISDGPFAMRMGPEDCYFFVVGDGEIILKIAGYVRKDIWLY